MIDGKRLHLLPNLTAFIRSVAGDLALRKSVLVLLPANLDAGVIYNLCIQEAYSKDCYVREVDVAGQAAGSSPLRTLTTALIWGDADAQRYGSVRALVAARDVSGIVALHGLERSGRARRASWFTLMAAWAEAAAGLASEPDRFPAALFACHQLEPGEAPPAPSLFLHVRWAWGLTSALDNRIVIRSLHEQPGERLDARAAWREAVIPALAGGDLRLGQALWDAVLGTPEHITAVLCAYARSCNWAVTGLRKLGMDEVLRAQLSGRTYASEPRAGPECDLWAIGAVNFTPEEGVAVSSAALALLGDDDALRHRLWEGQAGLVLREVDRIRMEACQRLTRLVGNIWITVWANLPAEEQDALIAEPMSAEFTQIARALYGAPSHLAARLPEIQAAHRVRNQLAHYAPVSFGQYSALHRSSVRHD